MRKEQSSIDRTSEGARAGSTARWMGMTILMATIMTTHRARRQTSLLFPLQYSKIQTTLECDRGEINGKLMIFCAFVKQSLPKILIGFCFPSCFWHPCFLHVFLRTKKT